MKIDSGSALRALREAAGLSQAKLSELSGVDQHILSAFECDKRIPDSTLLPKIRAALCDRSSLENLVRRKKRYRQHVYLQKPQDESRAALHSRTDENQRYVGLLAKLHQEPARKIGTAISLFSGCGGMSLGFTWAGYEIKAFLELVPGLRGIYRDNFPGVLELPGDIADFDNGGIRKVLKKVGEVDLVIGGPPCQGFSLSGKRSARDARNALFLDYLRFVDVFRPKAAVMENVRLLTSMKLPSGRLVQDEIKRHFHARGYSVEMFHANAKDFGVPQHRERIFFIAVRNDIKAPPGFPAQTHGPGKGDSFGRLPPHRNFADACSDLAFLESGETSRDPLHTAVKHPQHVLDWLWNVPEGRSAHENDDPAKRPPSGYNTTYKRQVWSEPGATVQTTFGMISGCRNVHPIATRSLTVREAARLQSFPDGFRFRAPLGVTRVGIGNAVPPLLAYAVARHMALQIL